MISICIQCVFIVFLRSYQALEANTSQISTRQWTTQVVPDQLNVKTMILIFFQCVFNVYSRSYQALEAENCPNFAWCIFIRPEHLNEPPHFGSWQNQANTGYGVILILFVFGKLIPIYLLSPIPPPSITSVLHTTSLYSRTLPWPQFC